MDTHSLPEDLVMARRAFTATYEALAAPRPRQDRAALRRRLLRLYVQVWWHPYWATSRSGPAARVRLRELARASTGLEGWGEVRSLPSERQVEILRALRGWIADTGEVPSVRELGAGGSVEYQFRRAPAGPARKDASTAVAGSGARSVSEPRRTLAFGPQPGLAGHARCGVEAERRALGSVPRDGITVLSASAPRRIRVPSGALSRAPPGEPAAGFRVFVLVRARYRVRSGRGQGLLVSLPFVLPAAGAGSGDGG